MRRQHESPQEICARKIHYPSREAAVLNKRSMGKDELWVYECGDHWHLGHPSVKQLTRRLRGKT